MVDLASVYLRLSVTDACNLRCRYCRTGREPAHRGPRLSATETVDLVRLLDEAVPLRKIRLTGGEPLLRPDLVELVAALHEAVPRADLCLTTNGTLLERGAAELRAAGLRSINISLDAADGPNFAALTGGGPALHAVLRGVDAARAAGFAPLKLNAVLLRSINGGSLADLVRLAAARGVDEIRFIELMPFGTAAAIFEREFLGAGEALAVLLRSFDDGGPISASDTATRRRVRDRASDDAGEVVVGFIAPVSKPFCGSCDRLRLDSRGRLYSCLRQNVGRDLATALRAADVPSLRRAIRKVLEGKRPANEWPARSMASLGG